MKLLSDKNNIGKYEKVEWSKKQNIDKNKKNILAFKNVTKMRKMKSNKQETWIGQQKVVNVNNEKRCKIFKKTAKKCKYLGSVGIK